MSGWIGAKYDCMQAYATLVFALTTPPPPQVYSLELMTKCRPMPPCDSPPPLELMTKSRPLPPS